jgi:class 3 adenylate cyclase/tetratricopeptide (TPR) repeat protein
LLGLFSPAVYRAENLSENLRFGPEVRSGQDYSAGGGAAMQEIADWLKTLGLSEYAKPFAENGIDVSALRHLTDQDLKDIGVLLGHRRKMLAAIGELSGAAPAIPEPATGMEPKTQDTAERRQVTVMFSDLVGSTALSARMDPEDLREVISAYQKCVAETVRRFGGFVAKYMGDGVLVYFGYPQAHEHDAERAVRAGLELIAAVAELKTPTPLQTRVGIATGLVVVGDLIGSGEAQERGIVGETPNLAARLQALAEPNMMVIGEGTRRLLGNLFELQDLGARDLKGIAGPVQAWAALRASSAEDRFEAMHATGLTALVGREEELELLLRRWSRAKSGEGQVVLLSGEAGIGKSRLTAALLENIATEPHTRLRFFCSPHHQDSALYPAISQLERAAGFQRNDTVEQRLDKLEGVLSQGTNDLGEAVPLIAQLLSIATGDRYPALDLTPQKRKEKTLSALIAQVEGLSAGQPALMVSEDIHWSDPTTRELLDLTIDRIPNLRVLVILTFRPEFTPPWVGRPQVTLLSLNRLPRRQRSEMIEHVTGGKALPKEITDQIIDRTDGVPLFIEELTKSVIESGLVAEAGGRYMMTAPATPLAIPTTLHASLLERLDRLAPTREVAQIGAALGRSFSHELISAVAQMPQRSLDDALEQLVSAELIFRRGMPPDAEYTFKHALVQDAAYSTLLRSRRQQIHARIAATLENQFPDLAAAQPELLAQHCAEAGLNEKAVGYLLKAGQQAYVRSAMTEAMAQFQKGLDLLPRLPDDRGRQQHELDLQIGIGLALHVSKGYSAPAVEEAYGRARELAEQLDRPDYLAPLLFGLCTLHHARGELKVALVLAEELENFGKAHDNLSASLLGKEARGLSCLSLGELTSARALSEQCDALGDPAHRAVLAAWATEDPYVQTLGHLAVILALQGHIEQGRTRLNAALTEARGLRLAVTSAAAFFWASIFESIISSPHEAHRYAQELTALSNEHGFPFYVAWGNVLQGFSLTALGRPEEALDLATKGLSSLRAMGAVVGTPGVLAGLATAYGALGRPVEGLDCLGEAAKIIEKNGERQNEFNVSLVRGDLLLATGDRTMAEESYRRALATATQQGAKTAELWGATALARLWRDEGKRTEARNLLAPIYNWFTEGFDTPVLMEAKALLDELHD